MSKGFRRFLATSGVLALIGAFGFVAMPRDCDRSVKGDLELNTWVANIWARATGGEVDCDPWSRVESDRPIGAIAIEYSINAYAGPATTQIYVRPDGRGFVFSEAFPKSPYKSPDDALAKIDSSDNQNSFTFDDVEIYRKIRSLLAPLRNATGQDMLQLSPDRKFKLPGVEGKYVLDCPQSAYHSSVTIFWTGNFYYEYPGDLSYFSSGPAGSHCFPLVKAGKRLAEANRLAYQKLPKELMQRWEREYEATKNK